MFNELAYQIDGVHYTSQRVLNYTKYDLIFGFGQHFENSFKGVNYTAKGIYYATGAHAFFQNTAEAERVQFYNKKHDSQLFPKRTVAWC